MAFFKGCLVNSVATEAEHKEREIQQQTRQIETDLNNAKRKHKFILKMIFCWRVIGENQEPRNLPTLSYIHITCFNHPQNTENVTVWRTGRMEKRNNPYLGCITK